MLLPGAFAAIVLLMQARATGAPKFELASIRRCQERDDGSGGRGRKKGGLRSDPGSLHITCETIERLIQYAYLGYPEGRPWTKAGLPGPPEPPIPFSWMFEPIKGAPPWVQSEKFTIDAKPERPEPAETMRGPMMQRLLEERLQLKIRREPQDRPVYTLAVATGGPHLHPANGGNCATITFDPSAAPGPRNSSNLPGCGFFGPGEDGRLRTLGQTMAGLCVQASAWLDQEVVDRTEIAGAYDIVFDMPAADFMPHRPGADAAPEVPVDRSGEVSGALAKLGLQLTRSKVRFERLVIDHIERPSEN